MNIKYRLKKFAVKFRRSNKKDLELDEFQQNIYDTVVRLINDKDSSLSFDIISGRREIKNNDVVVIISKNFITIMNGGNYSKDYFDDRAKDSLIDKFNSKVNRRINISENIVKTTIKNDLSTILNNKPNDNK